MAMRPCENCLENNWKYEYINGYIRAICNNCGYEVEFEARNKEKIKEGSHCRKCNAIVEKKESKFNKKKLKKNYYFTHYYQCPECKENYWVEEFKIIN